MTAIVAARGVTGTLALEGLQAMRDAPSLEEARWAGLEYLDRICEKGDTEVERIYSEAALSAASQYMHHRSAYNCEVLALQALAAGLTTPLAVSLGTLGTQALHQSLSFGDARKIGRELLIGMTRDRDNVRGGGIARAAIAICEADLYYHKSAFNAADDAFKKVRDADLTASPERNLAAYGGEATKAASWGDARIIGNILLDHIVAQGIEPPLQAIAQQAKEACAAPDVKDREAVQIQWDAFAGILASPAPGAHSLKSAL